MSDIRTLTAAYVAAFDARDLDKVAGFLAEGFQLTDPEVTALTPKPAVLDYIKGLFDAHPGLSFVAHRVLVDGDASVIHFTLTLGETVLDGVDVIAWDGDKMTSMQAYLTPRG
ncbi:nuclear transport factor 2 family protein [Tropicibacter oceani]|uniref:Nuclear transport factor 2 family protein n=1 Tax=Tropicibacter oceani TaxID=3058420 RepID=A0ABY8QN57_9RHOB|nr:nuclear transport factor 2 family protein [Tropicibacter oceani]WGW06065.1 nuclear transport factor 2 family protein [Tropicibacter oceani]